LSGTLVADAVADDAVAPTTKRWAQQGSACGRKNKKPKKNTGSIDAQPVKSKATKSTSKVSTKACTVCFKIGVSDLSTYNVTIDQTTVMYEADIALKDAGSHPFNEHARIEQTLLESEDHHLEIRKNVPFSE